MLPPLCDAASPPFDAIFFDTFAEGMILWLTSHTRILLWLTMANYGYTYFAEGIMHVFV